uniref:Sepiapterin reductase b n=1 Tax=Pygocentrus nattereri TaxID=42514 RepID=A0A3B4DGF5_PYGNA
VQTNTSIMAEGSKDLCQALCIITGASRVKPRSGLLLVARSVEQLKELREDIATLDAGQKSSHFICTADGLQQSLQAFSNFSNVQVYPNIQLYLNFVCTVSRFTLGFTVPVEVNHYLSLNVSSTLSLTAGVLQAFSWQMGLQRTVVNISTLCALKAFPSWVLYCMGKAACDMIFQVLAEEEPDIGLLCSFSSMFSKGQLVSCQESGVKLMRLLLDNDYPSGAHVDFFKL